MRVPRNRYPRLLVLFGAAALLVLVAATSFWVGRAFSDDGPAAATDPTATPAATPEPGSTPTPIPTFPGNDVTPPPEATPDTSQPFWYVPYLNQDRMKPRFTGEVAGILVGPDVHVTGIPCSVGEAVAGTPDDVLGSPLEIPASTLPPGAALLRQEVANCRGQVIHNSLSFEIPADPDAGYFGGSLSISRSLSDPAVDASFPGDRWQETTVEGRQAALALPILPDLGLGDSAVIVFEDGVLTVVSAYNLPLDDILRTAETLFK